ncbi:CpsD/CapB family tyrosine-protein kinase [Vagococcus carniphilus]|uniref:CpsD/CapB family tyrosine-protein kinase n=1 Tax=Vagococcus carniphilus TaxID=218144 RepID=UPI00288C6CDE|nr:CpsD/CapB family tyrosine-protein kinase [Vagococcus carniphilus]MDT2815387.1 CpsD/CapB family tyrosine-protein kinase [Vagococcus carniphilus]MDT2865910.1 CpsD/CapB family tyrosine-protein kinase [Vagococcus carniphilus]
MRKKKFNKKMNYLSNGRQYQLIRTTILHKMLEKPIKSIAIVSPDELSGNSIVTMSLAKSFANIGKRVLLVNTNTQSVKNSKNEERSELGIIDYLNEGMTEIRRIIFPSGYKNLDYIHYGISEADAASLFSSSKMTELMAQMNEQFDLVFFDTTPICVSPDSQVISALSDTTILNIRRGVSTKKGYRFSKKLLESIEADILGITFIDF